ncbi:YtxH domain-containing protein [Agromyces mediolanus]|uniref:YtxH domain-containing protein n=1 Tax=Agromyces mediolanus TaxID=41986 RepID=UPI00203BDA73|nr:YtxH domain-containing protein [Agromyces mediolanus]MCM3659239.1 YtxH domain-containing protein [Agromyces mediolanus]
MKGKILFVVGLGVGYVLGTRAGRERYEQIKRAAEGVWNQPAVQQGVNTVTDFAKDKLGDVSDTVLDAAKSFIGNATRGSGATKSEVREAAEAAKRGVSKTAKAASSAVEDAANAVGDAIDAAAKTAEQAAKPAKSGGAAKSTAAKKPGSTNRRSAGSDS